jgi:abhydrolase domain-containing protein 12
MSSTILKYASTTLASLTGLYACLLGLLTTTTTLQTHIIYLHKLQMTWFKDLDTPEVFGFSHNQITPFSIPVSNNQFLYAWHILPTESYRKHEPSLILEKEGKTEDITQRLGYKLLRDDPEALLAVHFHGAGGTVGSGYRPPNYRAISGASDGVPVSSPQKRLSSQIASRFFPLL